jgi:hypothetical protein
MRGRRERLCRSIYDATPDQSVLAHFFSFFNAKEVAGLPPSNALSLST